jgi:hypothetical protein
MNKRTYLQLYKEELSEREAETVLLPYFEKIQLSLTHSDTLENLINNLSKNHEKVLQDYRTYLSKRSGGSTRTMFGDVLQAKYYLMQTAPTKLVDGSWLSGVKKLPDSPVKKILQTIYEEEMGEPMGSVKDAKKSNHVQVYEKLLQSLFTNLDVSSVESWTDHFLLTSTDSAFEEGCKQMALAKCTEKMLPEIVGYNLGYEQLPLHMLITMYELRELGIDAQYFNLHITVDNYDTGHAKQALNAVFALLQNTPENSYLDVKHRILIGYMLNHTSMFSSSLNAMTVASAYDLDTIVVEMFRRKGSISYSIHDEIFQQGEDSLGKAMERGDGETILQMVKYQGYFDDEIFEKTWFYRLVTEPDEPMFRVFNEDELEYLKAWHIHDKVRSRILKIFGKVCGKHRKIIMTHPDTGISDDMAGWYAKDVLHFYKCASTPYMKEATRESFLNGRMKNVKISDEDREFVISWCGWGDLRELALPASSRKAFGLASPHGPPGFL